MKKRDWLIQIRTIKGLNQSELAVKINKTQQYYNYIENGVRNPSVAVAQKIAEVLDFDWILFYPKKEKPKVKKCV